MDRAAWLEERRSGIGSSDAPCLIGAGFRSAAEVYRDKVAPADRPDPTSGPLARGLALEPVVAAMYCDAMGGDGWHLNPGSLTRRVDRPWQLATPDYRRLDNATGRVERLVELKTTAGFGEQWGEPGTDRVPDGYRVQVQHQMGVCGVDACDVAALDVVAWEFRVYRVAFDPGFFAALTAVEKLFWRHVTSRSPLPAGWDEQWARELPAAPVPGKRVELGPDVAAMLDRRAALCQIASEAEAEADAIAAAVKAALGDAEAGDAPGWRVKWVTRKAHTRPACEVKESRYLDIRAARGKP